MLHPYMHQTAPTSAAVAPAAEDPAENRAVKMDGTEAGRVRAASYRARRLLPGPIGEYLAWELAQIEEMSLRLDRSGRTGRMIDAVLNTPIPGETV